MKTKFMLTVFACCLLFQTLFVQTAAHASADRASNWAALNYAPYTKGLEVNPLKGFVPYDAANSSFPHSMEWFSLPLSSLQTGMQTFNWTPLEKKLDEAASRGHQAVFRIYLDYPGEAIGVPRFLIDAGVPMRSYSAFDNETSMAPDWNNELLLTAMTNFIGAFGKKYDRDPRIGYITAGLYGFWGEWHVYPYDSGTGTANWSMSSANQVRLLEAYRDAFSHTQILLRNTTEGAASTSLLQQFGFHDDSFAYSTIGPETWQFAPSLQLAGLSNQWRTHAVGGELRPELQSSIFAGGDQGQGFQASVDATHISWMINNHVFDHEVAGSELTQSLNAHNSLGYQLHIPAVNIPRTIANGAVQVGVQIQNKGNAPFYYPWQTEIGLLGSNGSIVRAAGGINLNLPEIQPGAEAVTRFLDIDMSGLPQGTYKIALRVVNPLPNGSPVRFATEGQDQDAEGWMTLGSTAIVPEAPSAPSTGLPTTAPSAPVDPAASMMLDNFNEADQWSRTNDLGLWTGANSFDNGGGSIDNGALMLNYRGDGYFGSDLKNINLSGYKKMIIRVKGSAGGEENHVKLQLGGVNKFLSKWSSSVIATEYADIVIDLKASGVNLASPKALKMTFWHGYTGTIWIDEIRFEA
ncbi:DUF4832 domain-containing protein [Paenibacillus methanolicus]|uniref:Uncharacterized protein DUF4832 n=1 Tax=Paenibacillus methanolicus TaxID=582686 RepID=A0A5S5BN87_9BACL|nr:DUF4832 domain-containing protein [Paenibacillus methanolicus]TYP68631.1 uncharacterized protein DUF4832 [Paenibacillus methanolicus]